MRITNKIEFLCGADEDYIGKMSCYQACTPFSDQYCDFLAALSEEIMNDPEARGFPDVITFGFFCRRANLNRMKKEYEGRADGRLGRGVTFHIAPSNVPINFAYSMAAALLAGNCCIVRASSKPFRQVDIVCRCMTAVMDRKEFIWASLGISIVRYGHDKEVTDYLSSLCDVRIIWGGDNTIAEIRKSPLPPRSTEITFADRYSIAVISSAAILREDNTERLSRDFYNDTYLYDQNACSSPRLVYWLGSREETEAARKKFWGAVHEFIKGRYELAPVVAVEKYMTACRAALDIIPFRPRAVLGEDNLISRIEAGCLKMSIIDYRCPGGSFFEYSSERIDDLQYIARSRKVQTVAYYGDLKDMIREFAIKWGFLGVDRIVPIGKTADFSLVWDGHDLILDMSRIVGY